MTTFQTKYRLTSFAHAKDELQGDLATFTDSEIEYGVTLECPYEDWNSGDRFFLCVNTRGKTVFEVYDRIEQATKPQDLADVLPALETPDPIPLSEIISNYSDRSLWNDIRGRKLKDGTRLTKTKCGTGFRITREQGPSVRYVEFN